VKDQMTWGCCRMTSDRAFTSERLERSVSERVYLLGERVSRIEGEIQHLATKADAVEVKTELKTIVSNTRWIMAITVAVATLIQIIVTATT